MENQSFFNRPIKQEQRVAWDLLVFITIIFVAFNVPYSILIGWKNIYLKEWIDNLVLVIFILDMFINCQTEQTKNISSGLWGWRNIAKYCNKNESIESDSIIVNTQPAMFKTYVTSGWFVIDILAVIPFYLILPSLEIFEMSRTIRLIRVLKIIRIFKMSHAKSMFSNFWNILTPNVFFISIIAVVLTTVCYKLNWVAKLPEGMIAIAIVFPMVFSINAAYKRRDESLRYLSAYKSNVVSLLYAYRDWPSPENEKFTQHSYNTLRRLVEDINQFLFSQDENSKEVISKIYIGFSNISKLNNNLRTMNVAPPEISNLNGRLNNLVNTFENLRNISEYRTSKGIKAYSSLFLHIFPLLYSPLFAYYSIQFHWLLGVLLCVLYSVSLVLLDCIQDNLENPFDQDGMDDIKPENIDFYFMSVETDLNGKI